MPCSLAYCGDRTPAETCGSPARLRAASRPRRSDAARGALEALVAAGDAARCSTSPSQRPRPTATRARPSSGARCSPRSAGSTTRASPTSSSTRYPRPASPSFKPRAVELLTAAHRLDQALLAAVGAEQVPADGAQRQPDPQAASRARTPTSSRRSRRVWGTIREGRNPHREQVVARIGRARSGDARRPAAGRPVFKKLCAQCHKIYGEGQDVGPDITAQRPGRLRAAPLQRLRPQPGHRRRATRRRPSPPPTAAS